MKEALKLALEALNGLYLPNELARVNKAIIAIKEALVQPEQEPVAVRLSNGVIDCLGTAIVPIGALLYTTPPQRTWVGLTDEEMLACNLDENGWMIDRETAKRNVEAKLKEKNT